MGWTLDGFMDPDEALRALEMLVDDADHNFALMIESKGTPIEGECKRKFEDGKPRLDIGGYYLFARVETPTGSSKGKVVTKDLLIVRQCDAATASIASLLKNQDDQLKLLISVFKAGGDDSPDAQPTLELSMEGARVKTHTMLVGGRPQRPSELVTVAYRKLEIRSAPQTATGARGAVRTCTLLSS
jgi:hypothetical protein